MADLKDDLESLKVERRTQLNTSRSSSPFSPAKIPPASANRPIIPHSIKHHEAKSAQLLARATQLAQASGDANHIAPQSRPSRLLSTLNKTPSCSPCHGQRSSWRDWMQIIFCLLALMARAICPTKLSLAQSGEGGSFKQLAPPTRNM